MLRELKDAAKYYCVWVEVEQNTLRKVPASSILRHENKIIWNVSTTSLMQQTRFCTGCSTRVHYNCATMSRTNGPYLLCAFSLRHAGFFGLHHRWLAYLHGVSSSGLIEVPTCFIIQRLGENLRSSSSKAKKLPRVFSPPRTNMPSRSFVIQI